MAIRNRWKQNRVRRASRMGYGGHNPYGIQGLPCGGVPYRALRAKGCPPRHANGAPAPVDYDCPPCPPQMSCPPPVDCPPCEPCPPPQACPEYDCYDHCAEAFGEGTIEYDECARMCAGEPQFVPIDPGVEIPPPLPHRPPPPRVQPSRPTGMVPPAPTPPYQIDPLTRSVPLDPTFSVKARTIVP